MPSSRASSAARIVFPLPLGPVMAMRIALDAELAASHDDGGAADFDALDRIGRAVDARVERRGPADLLALRDLDLVAERDAAVPGEMERERPRGGAGGGVLCDAEHRAEHPRRPGEAVAGEAVDAVGAERGELLLVGLQRRYLLDGAERDEHVAQAVVVHLDREQRLDPENRLQLRGALE